MVFQDYNIKFYYDLDIMTLKFIGVTQWPLEISLQRLTNLGLSLLKLLIRKAFYTKCHCDLDI
jgi:hypothetical protein